MSNFDPSPSSEVTIEMELFFQLQSLVTGVSLSASFSFFPSKPLGCYGDGGLVVFEDAESCEHARLRAQHGARKGAKYNSLVPGWNSRLDGIQAAILSAKLPDVPQAHADRQAVAARYAEGLADLDADLKLPDVSSGHALHQYTVTVRDPNRRDPLMRHCAAREVETAVVYPWPLDRQDAFRQFALGDLPVARQVSAQILSLPCWSGLREDEVGRVIDAVRGFFA